MVNYLLFFSNSTIQTDDFVPNQLDLITSNGGWMVGLVLIIGISLIALSRVYEANYLKGLVRSYFGPSLGEDIQKADINLSSLSSIIILLNAFFGFWIVLYLFIKNSEFPLISNPALWSALGALIFVFTHLSTLLFTAFLTGELSRMRDLFVLTILNIQFSGLFFLLFGLVWFLNPSHSEVFSIVLLVALLFTVAVRFLKGIYASLTNGISWYYIILYFCTLEILPLYILYIVVKKYFAF